MWLINLTTSCGAAIRVKPKARLCEPWVFVSYMVRAAKRRQRISRADYQKSQSPLRGQITLVVRTQGSQSLALGLILIAAPQLVLRLARLFLLRNAPRFKLGLRLLW